MYKTQLCSSFKEWECVYIHICVYCILYIYIYILYIYIYIYNIYIYIYMSSKFVSSESGDPIIIKYNLIINCNHFFDNNVSIIFSRWMHFQPASFCDIIYPDFLIENILSVIFFVLTPQGKGPTRRSYEVTTTRSL